MTTQHLALKKGKSGYMNIALLKSALMIAIPVTLQTLFFSSKGLIDLMMIGQLSEENIAAMGVGSRALFVATILLSGVTAGGAMLVAQFHGARKEKRISQSTALTWLMTSLFAIAPMLLFATYGADIVGLSSGDDIVRHLGHQYLTITGISLLFIAYSTSIAAALRSTHQATLGNIRHPI
ncbi:hypothetical protein GCM10007932_33180 [Vibrio penaeicida]|uniref:Na(+)/drug antiporter n=1 Tax=Vibrio penaeicida TaxID=104609 RepID=A0AAV5NUS1_9VIBR|nr:hypothetical protein GCM10007932_33180 [Vibrio penaeicida]